jgi:hypothetical protein
MCFCGRSWMTCKTKRPLGLFSNRSIRTWSRITTERSRNRWVSAVIRADEVHSADRLDLQTYKRWSTNSKTITTRISKSLHGMRNSSSQTVDSTTGTMSEGISIPRRPTCWKGRWTRSLPRGPRRWEWTRTSWARRTRRGGSVCRSRQGYIFGTLHCIGIGWSTRAGS